MLLASPARLPMPTASPVASALPLAMFPESAVLASTATVMSMLGLLALPVAAAAARRLTLALPGVLLTRAIFSGNLGRSRDFFLEALRIRLGGRKGFRDIRLRF